jgi:hypothetical protein
MAILHRFYEVSAAHAVFPPGIKTEAKKTTCMLFSKSVFVQTAEIFADIILHSFFTPVFSFFQVLNSYPH